MNRIPSTFLNRPAGSDPLGPARAAARVADAGNRLGRTLEVRDQAEFQTRDRDARLFSQVERARVQRELGLDVEDVRNSVPETGVGFADGAISKFDQRVRESLRRAGNDPLRKKYITEAFKVEREQHLGLFQQAEKTSVRDYSYSQHMLSLDDFKQQIGRTSIVEPKNSWREQLGQSESGGRYDIVNDEGFMGKYQFGSARLGDYKRATGEKFTDEEFLKNGALQERVQEWAEGDIDEFVLAMGLDRFIGKEINGITMTAEAMRGVAHLGGKTGLQKYLNTGGKYNPADSNGTKLSDYARQHGGTDRLGVPFWSGPLPDLKKNPAFVSALSEMHAQIDAMDITKAQKSQMKREAEAELTASATVSIGRDNPGAALALLRSGNLDSALSHKQSSQLEGFMESSIASIESEIARGAKAQSNVEKQEARDRFIDWKAWGESGGQGERPDFAEEDMASLTIEQQREARNLPGVWHARQVANTIPIDQGPEFLTSLAPSGEGYAAEKAALDAAQEVMEDRLTEDRVDTHISGSLAAGLLPNMGDKDVSDEINHRFQDHVGDSETPIEDAMDFLRTHKVAPKALNQMVASIMGGENAEAKVSLASELANMEPRDLASLDAKPLEAALALNGWLAQGLTMEEAEGLTRDLLKPTNKSLHDARSDQWKDKDAALPETVLASFMEHIGDEGTAELPPTVWAEYEEIARAKFLETGNTDISAKLAATAFLRRHDVSYIGGQHWMRDPAERVYSVYGDPKRDAGWIEEQALTAARKQFPKAKHVSLELPRDQQEEERPAYRVFVDTGDGIDVMSDLFRPDDASEREVFERELAQNEATATMQGDVAVQRAKLRDAQEQRWHLLQAWREADERFSKEGAPHSEVEDAIRAFKAQMKLIEELKGEHKTASDDLADRKRADAESEYVPPEAGTRRSILEDQRYDYRYGRQ